MMLPVNITAITICFNNLDELLDTCGSVDRQAVLPYEHIIIDGSTKPAIKNYLEQHPQPPYRRWLSERDQGIADAFNKGIALAKGNVVVMLNAGDTFYDEKTIKIAMNAFLADPDLQWIHGKYELVRGNQQVIIGKPYERSKLYRGMRSISHQSMFVKKALHNKYGLYNTDEKIAMDYDFLCRIANEKMAFINAPMIRFAPAGISSSQYLLSLKEAKRVYQRYFGRSLLLDLWQLRLKLLYYLLNSPVGTLLYKIKTRLKLENM